MLITATDVISRSIKVYRENASLLLKYAGLILIPAVLIMLAGYSLGVFIVFTNSIFLGFGLYSLLVFLLSLVGFTISLSMIRVVAALYQNQPAPDLVPDLKSSLGLLLPAILVSILSGLAIVGGLILLIIPGIIFAVWFMFSLHALMLDNKHTVDALKYSKSLVKGRWGEVLWKIILPTLAFALIFAIIQWIFRMMLSIDEEMLKILTVKTGIYTVLTICVSALMTPITTAVPTILYVELKKTPVGTSDLEQVEDVEEVPEK
ncbi:hypothetical protein HOF40_02975 [Candidatus Parcubacteria bacterium]|jgi:hypothetical protein|nr:hypothetical protein [Candidatus Parcubacteria bacterium]MBT3949025.1 hypothetical protein [Candidatus Parcubacteria bacterium]